MNFIVAQLLLHCSETFAFWLFVALIKDYKMEEIYGLQLRGLFLHSAVIEVLLQANLPELHQRLHQFNLKANIYAGEWIVGLFASVIPTEHMGAFFDKFFEQRWPFFYQLVLTLLKRHEKEIRHEEDMYSLLRQIKVAYLDRNTKTVADQTINRDLTEAEAHGLVSQTGQSEESVDREGVKNTCDSD